MRGQDHDTFLMEHILGALSPVTATAPSAGQCREAAESCLQFMDEMPGGFLIYHADHGEEIIFANRALLRIFQCRTMEEFREHTNNSFRGLVHPDDLDQVEESIWEQISASQYDLDYVEYRIRRKDGAIRWIEDYGHFVHSDKVGDIFYVFLGDATEKRDRLLEERSRLVSETRERDQRIQNLMESYDQERDLINQEYIRQLEVIEGLSINYESICYLDLDADHIFPYRLSTRTRVLFENRLQTLPYSQYYIDYIDQWVHPEDREMVFAHIAPDVIRKKLAENRTYFFNYRVVVNEEVQYLQLRFVNVSRVEGVCQAVLGYRRVDEEIRQQMEQQALLADALAKANLAVTSKNTFLSNISHDMRTPLNAIFGFTSLAKMSLDKPEEAAGYLDRVEAASRQLLDMIEKVLEVSAMSSTTGVTEVECDLLAVIQGVYEFLQPQAVEKNITFDLDLSGLHHQAVFTDPEKLRQLVLYLGNNAVTYTNPGGKVSITVSEGKELPNHYAVYRLEVKDNGIGISPEFLEQIFEPFVRERNSTLSGVHSIGLGLTIAKNIVDLMGGTLEVQSKVNEGSTFTAVLRFRRQVWDSVPQKAREPRKDTQRILLAEDNELNREIETELLEKLGFDIDPVENGQIALEKLKGSAPGEYDLVLMDLQMPVLDGWQTSAAIRALPEPKLARIPIIALSANVMDADQQRSKQCGIDAHLLKPMDLPLLLRTIEKLTGKPQRKKKK